MNFKSLHAFAIALGVAGAAAMAATPLLSTTAEAATVRPAVGKPLQQAISLANAGKGAAAMEKVHEAESVSGLTGSEQAAISQTRNFVAAKTGAGGGAVGCKTKFANDYSANRFRDVVGADVDCLRKAGAYDYQSQVIVAQAYYQMGDYPTAIKLLKALGDNDQVLSVLMAAAGKSGDTQTEGQVAERLILKGQTKYWTYLLTSAQGARLSDPELLDVYRVRLATGNMRNADDYETMAQLALELGFPTEGVSIAQKGFDAKVLEGARDQRLQGLAQAQAAKDAAGLAKTQQQAQAAKNGDLLLKYGENLWGMGKFPEALDAVSAGLKKGVSKANDANLTLGIVSYSAGQKDAALKAFAAVKNDPGAEAAAKVWTVFVRSGGKTASAATSDDQTNSSSSGSTPPKKSRHRH
jgi:tetratricopeptide (TPR) repeat protein